MTCPSEKTPGVVGFERFDSKAAKYANGVRDVNAAHGTRAAVVEAARAVKKISSLLQTPNLKFKFKTPSLSLP